MAAAAAPKSQGRQAQYWFVTLWPELNPALKAALPANGVPTSESVTAYLSALVGDDLTYAVYNCERCPTTGRIHCHIALRFAKPKRFDQVKKFLKDPTLHVDEQMGTYDDVENYEYLWLDKDGKPRKTMEDHYWGPEHLGVQPPNPKGGRPCLTGKRDEMVVAISEAIKAGE